MAIKLFSGFVAMVAGLFMIFNPWSLSTTELWIVGVIAIIVGISLTAVPNLGIGTGFGLMVVGIYCFARASGAVSHELLRYGLGIPVAGFGMWLLFSALTESKDSSSPQQPLPPLE